MVCPFICWMESGIGKAMGNKSKVMKAILSFPCGVIEDDCIAITFGVEQ